MNSFISVSREALAQLLQATGSPLTPEQFAASFTPPLPPLNPKYPARARMAVWSKRVMLIIAVLSVVGLPFSFDLEGVLVVTGLCVATFFEYRTHRYFLEGNPAAPTLGFRNQSGFAAGILAYCLYHAFVVGTLPLPAEYKDMIDASQLTMIQGATRAIYLLIGVTGGLSQFGLAWYYRSAKY
jgi:hypothetical protein